MTMLIFISAKNLKCHKFCFEAMKVKLVSFINFAITHTVNHLNSYEMSHNTRKPVFGVSDGTRSDRNLACKARSLKFQI